MTDSEQINAFDKDVRALIGRYTSEFNLSFAAAIGVLHLAADRLSATVRELEDDDDEGED